MMCEVSQEPKTAAGKGAAGVYMVIYAKRKRARRFSEIDHLCVLAKLGGV